jgi:hypothetical protein
MRYKWRLQTGTCLPPSDGNFAVCVSPIHETAAATAPAVTPTFGVYDLSRSNVCCLRVL